MRAESADYAKALVTGDYIGRIKSAKRDRKVTNENQTEHFRRAL